MHTSIYQLISLGALLSAAACSSTLGHTRFHNQAPVLQVNDRKDVPKKPEFHNFYKMLYHFDGFIHKRITRWTEFRGSGRALGVNSMDEVPNSTWFTNRIGVRDMTVEDVRVGPNVTGTPEDHKPWTIKSSKVGGASVGFIIKDTRGVKYLLKFDQKGEPETETGADIALAKILFASGYNTPEDYVVHFNLDDLVLADDAMESDAFGHKKPMTKEFVAKQLKKVEVAADGSIRGLTSQFLGGLPIGGPTRDGVREDDPNDVIRHEKRRDIRGQFAFFSWLDHSDIKEDNTLDIWKEDPKDPSRHYVEHYLLDFGNALGTQAVKGPLIHVGYAHTLDFKHIFKSMFTFGLWKRPWEGREIPDMVGVGFYGINNYDPENWRPYTSSYFPFLDVDRFDNFWASKIIIRFTEPQLRAAVTEGKYSDPRAVDYLTKTLVKRQRKTAKHWFRQVDPLDGFEVKQSGDSYTLCWTDLALLNKLETSKTSYKFASYNYDGKRLGWKGTSAPNASGRACAEGLKAGSKKDGYTLVKIHSHRAKLEGEGTVVHMAKDKSTNQLRIVGLRRL